MNTFTPIEYIVTQKLVCLGTVSRGRTRVRAMELAMTDGRNAQEAGKLDWEQAKRELGASFFYPFQAAPVPH